MSKLFISHSSRNNVEAAAIATWLAQQGWSDVFLDLDPSRGVAAGERWRAALNQAANRCEAVLCLVSAAWLASKECQRELALADKLNKALFCALIEDIPLAELPALVTGTWQTFDLAAGRDHEMIEVELPRTLDRQAVTFSRLGLARLKAGLAKAGLDPSFFAWPPPGESKRSPYPGLRPLEAGDAGIFFGREAQIVEALDRLRATREAPGSRFLCLLGASGSGKSSFLRAGLWPRLARDDRTFLPLPVLRPERAALSGTAGLAAVLDGACETQGLPIARAAIREAIAGGEATMRPFLLRLAEAASARLVEPSRREDGTRPPLLVLPIDQGEELFGPDGQEEAGALLALLRDILRAGAPDLAVVLTIRSDAFERLQLAPGLAADAGGAGVAPQTMAFGPMPRGVFATLIEGPAARMRAADRPLAIDPALTRALLDDIEAGGGKDALPLLAFTLERLWRDYGSSGRLTLADYEATRRIEGAIEAAVAEALRRADTDARIPRDRDARLALLRRGLVPWLAGIDPDTNLPRRRIARRSEVPAEALPLIDLLVEERLLSADVDPDTQEATLEPAHEALLRQWGLLQGWLEEDLGLLATLEGVRRATRDWHANARGAAWLAHRGDRLAEAERLSERPDLAAQLGPSERDYLAACQSRADADAAEARTRARMQRALRWSGAAAAFVLALTAWSVLLGLNSFKQSLVDAYIQSLTVQGDIIAGAIAASATVEASGILADADRLLHTREGSGDRGSPPLEFSINPERLGPLLRRLITPTGTRSRIFDRDGMLIVDSRTLYASDSPSRAGAPIAPRSEPTIIERLWRSMATLFGWTTPSIVEEMGPTDGRGLSEVERALAGQTAASVRSNVRGETVVSVAVPIQRMRTVGGALLLSTPGGVIDAIITSQQFALLQTFLFAAVVMLLLSYFLAKGIVIPARGSARTGSATTAPVPAPRQVRDETPGLRKSRAPR